MTVYLIPEKIFFHARGDYHKRFYGILFLCILSFLNSCAHKPTAENSLSETAPVSDADSPETRLQQGISAYARGRLTQAVILCNDAAEKFKQDRNPAGRSNSLLWTARVCLASGRTARAADCLAEVDTTAAQLNDPALSARTYALKGNLHHISGEFSAAETCLAKALSIAQMNHYQRLSTAIQNDMGNLMGSLGKYPEALSAYRASAILAKDNGRSLQTAVALANAAKICAAIAGRHLILKPATGDRKREEETATRGITRALLPVSPEPRHQLLPEADRQKAGQYIAQANGFLDEAHKVLPQSNNSRDKIVAHIDIGSVYLSLAEMHPQTADVNYMNASKEFSTAAAIAEEYQNARLISYAKGNLGRLHRNKGRFDQAIAATKEAIYWAERAAAPESLYRWQGQYARMLSLSNRLPEAVLAYQDALGTIETIRAEFSNCYGAPRSELRRAANGIYLQYVEVLLKQVDGVKAPEQQEILKRAREVLEKRKVNELREYFNDDCLGAAAMETTNLDELVETAVIIYLVLLPDRLEIIATFPGEAGRDDGEKENNGLTAAIRHYVQKVDAQTIAETAKDFRNALITMAPPGGYLEPAAALYDWLIRPLEKELVKWQPETIVFVPDGALRNIPMGALYNGSSFLIQSYGVAVTPGLSLSDPVPLRPEKVNMLAVGVSKANQDQPALPGVAKELAAISELYDGDVLINSRFSLSRFEEALQDDAYNVVHIASHGKFSGRMEESFILTADGRMTVNDLADFVGMYRFREQPLELLTLSACETAAGNDEAVLGMAGIAVKVGARSALATLWAVNDQAAARLVAEFYRRLRTPGVSRAAALRQAQKTLLGSTEFSHPGYWSPFILINNWL